MVLTVYLSVERLGFFIYKMGRVRLPPLLGWAVSRLMHMQGLALPHLSTHFQLSGPEPWRDLWLFSFISHIQPSAHSSSSSSRVHAEPHHFSQSPLAQAIAILLLDLGNRVCKGLPSPASAFTGVCFQDRLGSDPLVRKLHHVTPLLKIPRGSSFSSKQMSKSFHWRASWMGTIRQLSTPSTSSTSTLPSCPLPFCLAGLLTHSPACSPKFFVHCSLYLEDPFPRRLPC